MNAESGRNTSAPSLLPVQRRHGIRSLCNHELPLDFGSSRVLLNNFHCSFACFGLSSPRKTCKTTRQILAAQPAGTASDYTAAPATAVRNCECDSWRYSRAARTASLECGCGPSNHRRPLAMRRHNTRARRHRHRERLESRGGARGLDCRGWCPSWRQVTSNRTPQ